MEGEGEEKRVGRLQIKKKKCEKEAVIEEKEEKG